MTSHTRQWKETELGELKKLAKQYAVLALANIEGFPADLFSRTRKKLSAKAIVKVSKVRIIQKALGESQLKNKDFSALAQKTCAVILTNLSPFELYGFLKKNKGSTSAKVGQIAPNDIVIPAGDTGLPPGPALSDLKNAGLKVKMVGPTIHVETDTVVTKAGQPITPAVANVLTKLNIKPIKAGLSIIAVLEGDTVYLPTVLDVDEEQMLENIKIAYLQAVALALDVGYVTPTTITILIEKAFRETKIVALQAKIMTPYTRDEILAHANATAAELKNKLDSAPKEKPVAEKQE